jgi:hypothetical protein
LTGSNSFFSIIVKALGLKPETGDSGFSDSNGGQPYSGYIKTASEYKIMSGEGNGRFGAEDDITREQAITVIARAMRITRLNAGLKAGEKESLLAKIRDGREISEYAREDIALCIKEGIVLGRNGDLMKPDEALSRAETAALVSRLLKVSGLI